MENDSGNSQNTPAPRQYRRMGESAMKKVVILGGSVILCMIFSLIIAVNFIDQEWDQMEKVTSVVISAIGLIVFATVILVYVIFHIKKGRQTTLDDSTITNQQDIEDHPPNYEEIMGKLPSYDSYSKSTAQNIVKNESSLYACHV